jgi:hypothetical protein
LALLALVAATARANQFRVAVFLPEAVAATDAALKTAQEQAALWQSLATTELSQRGVFAVVDRDDLPTAAREWALSLAGGAGANASAPAWQGADFLVIGRLALTNSQCALSLKVLNVSRGVVESSFTESFAATNLEQQARALPDRLQPLALRWLAGRGVHTLASVLDFESPSRFDRGRWQERALARQLRGFLQRQPGVLVLEREDVEELLGETRLRRGGMAPGSDAPANAWSDLRFFPLISGSITETQPEGAPLALLVQTQVRDLASGKSFEFTNAFAVEQWADGVEQIEQQLMAVLRDGTNAVTSAAPEPDRSQEALALADKALRQSSAAAGVHNFSALLRHCPDGLVPDMYMNSLFVEGGLVGARGPGRRAALLQSVQYLKAAILADDRNPRIKLFLASLLVDSQVNEKELALELDEEVGWQFPQLRLPAWSHAYNHAQGDARERFLRLLIQFFPDSPFSRVPAQNVRAQFIEKHRHDPDLGPVVDAFRPDLDQALNDAQSGTLLQGEVDQLFELTQITGRNPSNTPRGYELQTPENRARGVALLEEMIQKYPRHAFFLCHFWAYCWDYRTDSDTNICYWLKRAVDAVPPGSSEGAMSVWWDAPRIKLAQRLMDRHNFAEALPYLEKISDGNMEERNLRLGQCAFELGDFQRALKLFRAFGPDHQEAAAWAAKCEAKLHLPPLAAAPKPYTVITNRADWRLGLVKQIPQGQLHALAVDSDSLWLGFVPHPVQFDENFFYLERVPKLQRLAEQIGGLVRWDRVSGETRVFTTNEGLPHRWVCSLATTPDGLWVGTLGGGLGLLNPHTGTWTVWAETNGLPINSVRSLAADGDNLWVGLGKLDIGGVVQLSLRTHLLRAILPGDYPARTNFVPAFLLNNPGLPEELKHPRVISYVPITPVSLLDVVDGRLWCVLPGKASASSYANFEPHGTVVFDRPSNSWYQSTLDAPESIVRVKDRVWLSLGAAGLANCDLKGGDWRRITPADGLPMSAGALCEWQGRLLILGDSLMLLDPEHNRFDVYPIPTPGDGGLMVVAGDRLYLVRGQQVAWLDPATLPLANADSPSPPK